MFFQLLLVLYCPFIHREGIVPYLKDVWEDVPNERPWMTLSRLAGKGESVIALCVSSLSSQMCLLKKQIMK